MKKYLLSMGAVMALSLGANAQEAGPTITHGLAPSAIDRSVKPTDDFDRFANGAWRSKDVIAADKPGSGLWDDLYERNIARLHTILESLASDNATQGDDQKLGSLYATGMDTTTIDRLGLKAIAPELSRIAAIHNRSQLVDTIAALHREGIGVGWQFYVASDDRNAELNVTHLYQGGLGLPDRDYYTKTDKASALLRKKYLAHVVAQFKNLGDAPKAAQAHAATVMALETRLARASMTIVEQRDPKALYNKFTLANLSKAAPGMLFERYFRTLGLPNPGVLIVGQPKFFKAMGGLLSNIPLVDWKTYLRWQTVHAAAPYLTARIDDENFAFFQKTLAGTAKQLPRWKRVQGTCDALMGEALGKHYVAVAFPPEAKAKAQVLIENILAVLRERIATLEWMSEATRKKALEKASAIRVKVGYPDKWRDYSALKISRSASYWDNIRAGLLFEFERNLRKVGKPIDRGEWSMSPPTINAYYNPNFNDINFPAGILQPGFFDPNADDAVNYGAIGMVIGHEITHGFDDQGRQYDAKGNLRDWWTPTDAKAYNQRAEQVVKQYDAYALTDGSKVVGKQTLGENLADIGGMRLAWLAYQHSLKDKPKPEDIDGFTAEQRFFLAFAQIWRSHYRPELQKLRVSTDVHSPDRFRVIGSVINMPEFFTAWGGAPPTGVMAKAPRPTKQIW